MKNTKNIKTGSGIKAVLWLPTTAVYKHVSGKVTQIQEDGAWIRQDNGKEIFVYTDEIKEAK